MARLICLDSLLKRLAEGFAKAEDEAFFTGASSEDSGNGGYWCIKCTKFLCMSSSIEDLTAEDLLV